MQQLASKTVIRFIGVAGTHSGSSRLPFNTSILRHHGLCLTRLCENGAAATANCFHAGASLGKSSKPSIYEPEDMAEPFSTTLLDSIKQRGLYHEDEVVPKRLKKDMAEPFSTTLLDSIKQRGLYHEDVYRHWRQYKVKEARLTDEGRLVDIEWNDGHKSCFHAVWLRHNCLCPQCRLTHNNMVDLDQLDVNIQVKSIEMEGDEVLQFVWADGEDNVIHTGHILTSVLRKSCYSKESLEARYKQRAIPFHKEKTIPEVDYSDVMTSEKGLYEWLKWISEKGLCLVKNVPTVDNHLLEVAHRIGPSYQGVYGLIFDVLSKKTAIDAAYTSQRLYHHMDQIQQECPPGIQFLHCHKFDDTVSGGENQFVDAFEVAHELREKHPDLFDTLCRVPCNPQTIDLGREYKVEMYYQRTILTLNHRGDLVNVSWHPTVLGPLSVEHDQVIPFYKAYTTMAKMIENSDSQYHLRLRPGDLITFNNRRMTHFRRAYDSNGERYLQGTYIDSSIFQSKVQYLRSKFEDGNLVPHCGSMNWQ